jgi:molybdate transport system regulatory protein
MMEGFILKISASNVYEGAILNVHHGSVNDDIEIMLDSGGTRLTSVITSISSKSLGLEPGKKVLAFFMASWVALMTDAEGVKLSARNQLKGTVASIKEGVVYAEVWVRLDCGESLTAMITTDSLKDMAIEAGSRITAIIKSSSIMIGARE